MDSPDLFCGSSAWFSISTPMETPAMWVRCGGSVEGPETAEFLFSDDVTSADTHVLYPGSQIIVFHSDFVRTACKLGRLPAVTDYALDPWPLIDFWKKHSMAEKSSDEERTSSSETSDGAPSAAGSWPGRLTTRSNGSSRTHSADLQAAVSVHQRAVAGGKLFQTDSRQEKMHTSMHTSMAETVCECQPSTNTNRHVGGAMKKWKPVLQSRDSKESQQKHGGEDEEDDCASMSFSAKCGCCALQGVLCEFSCVLGVDDIETDGMILEDFDPANGRHSVQWKNYAQKCDCH